MLPRLRAFFSLTTPAVWVLLALLLISGAFIFFSPASPAPSLTLWVFNRNHQLAYTPTLETWNAEQTAPGRDIGSVVIEFNALERRLLSAFMSGTPVADLVEAERVVAAKTFTGPLEDIGFVDLTDRLHAEGLINAFSAPSFQPWTARGRIFGLPRGSHPILLAYRADLTDAAGIDLSRVETWDDFFAAMRPLMQDEDGDGRPDRYPLNFAATNQVLLEVLLLQGDGTLFDAEDRLALATERNAHILSTLATWCAGPGRVVIDAPDFNAAGNTLRLRGAVLSALMPDWLAGVWKSDLPDLSGKVRLMPLPAWEKGGRRTSVWGGTMIGIPKAAPDFETSWAIAKRLYADTDAHVRFFKETNIIPPLKSSWTHPVFSAPDPYFGGQPSGRLFIEQSDNIPPRSGSPYSQLALTRLNEVVIALADRVEREQIADPAVLLPEARIRLANTQREVAALIDRNVFLRPATPAPSAP